MLKNLGNGLWAKLAQLLRTLLGVTEWRGRHGVSAVQAELVESLKKTFDESGEIIESLKKDSGVSEDTSLINSNLINSVSKLDALWEANSREANESDYHSQINMLVRDMEIINGSNQYTIQQKSVLVFEKADELIAKANTFGVEQNFSLPIGTASRVELLLSESNRNYELSYKLHGCMLSILNNLSAIENHETIVNTFDVFKSAEELLAKEFNVFKNETELLGKIKHLANLYLLAISGMKNPSNWTLEFKSVCLNIISLIENDCNSELIPFEMAGETIYLSPNSAEGKAILRLNDIDNSDEWITVVEKNEKIDLEELDRKIRESGYLV
jgi:hypothetical protein